jgi:hypothetical protein
MSETPMIDFLNGANAMASAVAGLFFLRFWRQTRDRLFANFAAAFWLLGLNWFALALTSPAFEFRPFIYLIRLVAFGLILGAIVEKNRAGAAERSRATHSAK